MAILGKASATTLEVLNSSVFAGGKVNITTAHPYITGPGDILTLGGKKGDLTRGSGVFDYTNNCFRRDFNSTGMTLGSSAYKWADVYADKITGKISSTHNEVYNNVMWYRCGLLTEGTSSGNVTQTLSTDCKVYSTPITTLNYMNVMNLRLSWSSQYWHDIFCEPNTQDLYHRCVKAGSSGNWRTILDSENYSPYLNNTYLPLTGGTMSGDITFGENGGILFTLVGSLTCAGLAGLELEADGCVLHLESGYIDIVGTMRNSTGTISATAFYEISDARKKDIKLDLPLDKCYDLIDKCQTVIYSLKNQTQEQVGMIALEIEEFFPEVVATDEEGFKSLAYDRLVVICFKVLKDVIKRLEKLENGL